MYRATTVFLMLIFLLAAVTVAEAVEYSGNFRIEQNGKLIGAEKFSVNFFQDGSIKTESNGTSKEEEVNIESLTAAEYRQTGEIKNYQRELVINRVPKKLVAVNQGGFLNVQINTGVREMTKKVKMHPSALVLDVGIFHHFYVLMHKVSKKNRDEQIIPVVIPSEMREMNVSVKFVKNDAVEMENGFYEAEKFFVNLDNVGAILWMDSRGKIIRIDIPMQGFVVRLKDYKGKLADKINTGDVVVHKFLAEKTSFKAKDEITMSGLITKPMNLEGKLPAAIFISTAGPQDRNGRNMVGNIPTHTDEILDYLTEQGYLVLRYDDRGIGMSKGDLSQSTLSSQEGEVEGAIDLLKSRKDVDGNRICLIGHGEGGNVAMRVAAKRKDIKALVLLAPSSMPLTELALMQVKRRIEEEGIEDPSAYKESPIYRLIQQSRTEEKEFTVMGGRPIYLSIFRQWDKMKPVDTIGQVRATILHLQGGKDEQVFPNTASLLVKAAKGGGYSYKEFDKLDHFFIESDGTIGSYSDPDRHVDKDFLLYLAAWLGANL